jgi:hypothetical protein
LSSLYANGKRTPKRIWHLIREMTVQDLSQSIESENGWGEIEWITDPADIEPLGLCVRIGHDERLWPVQGYIFPNPNGFMQIPAIPDRVQPHLDKSAVCQRSS